jgi:signal transduction histidine kinase
MKALWPRSLRGRLMTVGVAGLLVALIAAAVTLYVALTYAVNRTLDNEISTAAGEVAAMVDEQRLPDPVPVSGAEMIQVVDRQGRVIGGSLTADRLTPLLRPDELTTALAGRTVVVPGSRIGVAGPLRVKALAAGPADDQAAVIAAVEIGDVLASGSALRTALIVAVPLAVALLAVIAWLVIGWTLRPVEQLRLGAERIGADDRLGAGRDELLPVPEAADEIRALAVTLNDMLARLSATRARQRSFVADAAHELRSPLTSMRTQLEVAQHLGEAGGLPADLLVEVDRLSALVEDLLLLARAADAPPAASEVFDCGELLAEVARSYSTARVPVLAQAPAATPVRGDRAELRRAVTNLLDNAVRHAASGVELAVRVDWADTLILVTDDGPGIPVADRERVFDRFTRLDDARDRDAGGTGLGLAITRELVRRAGGTVGFGTDPDASCAEIRLPTPARTRIEDARPAAVDA